MPNEARVYVALRQLACADTGHALMLVANQASKERDCPATISDVVDGSVWIKGVHVLVHVEDVSFEVTSS